MTAIPPNPIPVPQVFVNTDYAAMQANLIQQQVNAEISRLSREYHEHLKYEVEQITAKLKAEANKQIRGIAINVIAGIVGLFLIAIIAQGKAVNNSVIGFQNSVMGLQKEVMASQTAINTASRELATQTSLLATANKDVEAASRRLEATTSEYIQRLEALKQVSIASAKPK